MIPTPDLNLAAVLPLLLVSVGALVVLVGEIFFAGRQTFLGRAVTREWIGSVLAMVSALFLGAVVVLACQNFIIGSSIVFNPENPLIQLDRFANFSIALICGASLLSCLLSVAYLAELRINHGEYYALILLATAGMVLLVSAVDLVSVFLGIELMSIPIYVLAGFDRRKLRSNESALKYFLVGSFASALLLYGMALLFGATGHTDFEGIRAGFDAGNPLAMIGLGLVIVGFTFKISSVPFHQWTPDVYEGAPTSVTAFMSVTVKVAAFAAMLRIVIGAFDPAAETLSEMLWVLAVLTMVLGNVMALIQDNVKRMLAYSSIAHAGYLLIGLVVGTDQAYSALMFYLVVYVFMNLGAFAVIVVLANRGQDSDRVDDFAGLAESRPGLAALMTLFMLALAGIPGTGGFMAKFNLFGAAVAAGFVNITIIAVLASLVSVYYYLRLPVAMYMREPGEEKPRAELSSGEWAVLAVCAVAVILLGIIPNNEPGDFFSWLRALDWSRESIALLVTR
jgi:NADH-quinone oxidoreductase subunit N